MMLLLHRRIFCARTAAWAMTLIASLLASSREASAQVVQLPAVQTFGYSGSVSVPDQGQANIGGVTRQGSGSTTRAGAPLSTRATGSQTGGGATIVSASIIDLNAMDEAILNLPAATALGRPTAFSSRPTGSRVMNTITPHLYARRMGADELAPPSDRNAWEMALGGVGEVKLGPANSLLHDDSAVRFFMQRAKEANSVGRIAAARVYYRMAYERLTPVQRARLQEIQAKADAAAQPGQAGASTPAASGAAAQAAAASSNAPATSAASSPAGETPAAGDENANPFGSPF